MTDLLSYKSFPVRERVDAVDLPSHPDADKTEINLTAALLVLIAVLWLATRPYTGVIHDWRFYAVQVLHRLHPTRFAHDLYFQFGSQDRFTIFSRAVAPLVSVLGIDTAGIILTVVGQLLWVGGLLYLALGLIRPRSYALLAVAVTIALPPAYAVWSTGYGEPIVTPRLFAEALTMLALGLLLRRHVLGALSLLILSAMIHPLMTAPGLALALVYLAVRQPVWWTVIVAGVAAVASLAVGGIQPFANLRLTFDPHWFEIVRMRDGMCFITRWHADAYLRVLITVTLAILILASTSLHNRRFFWVTVTIGIGGLACTLLGADLAHNVFIAETQSYRSMWLLTLVTNLLLTPVLIELLHKKHDFDILIFMFTVFLIFFKISQFIYPFLLILAPLTVIISIIGVWQFKTNRQLPYWMHYMCLILVSFCCAVAIIFTYWYMVNVESLPEEFWRSLYSLALIIAALGIMTLQIRAMGPRSGHLLPWFAAALLPVALLGWDARTPWTRFVESAAPAPKALAALLPQNASVYWEGDVRMLWLRLQRPSYFSCTQGTGAVFFRGTAIAYQHRVESFWPLRTLDFHKSIYCPDLEKHQKDSRTRADLQYVCAHEPALDYLVLIRPVENVEPKIWDSPAPYQYERSVNGKLIVHKTNRFFIYSCSGLR